MTRLSSCSFSLTWRPSLESRLVLTTSMKLDVTNNHPYQLVEFRPSKSASHSEGSRKNLHQHNNARHSVTRPPTPPCPWRHGCAPQRSPCGEIGPRTSLGPRQPEQHCEARAHPESVDLGGAWESYRFPGPSHVDHNPGILNDLFFLAALV